MKVLVLLFLSASVHAAPLKIFTDRPKERMDKALDGFTKNSGVNTEVTVGSYDDLKAKLKAGEQADILILKDIIYLSDGVKAGLFSAMNANLPLKVDASMRDPQGLWTALAYRVRLIGFDPAMVDKLFLTTYEKLSEPGFKGQLCMRNAKEYMPTFVAWLISRYGEAKAKAIVEGWRANLAADFTTGDSASYKSVETGICSVTIGNHYYLARLKAADARFPVESAFPNQLEGGLHTNGYGIGIAKNSTAQVDANKLIEYLLSDEGQKALVADPSFEYPAVQALKPEQIVENFGSFKVSDINWNQVGSHLAKANEILERVGWIK